MASNLLDDEGPLFSKRTRELLTSLSKEFEEGRDIFNMSWLREHDVTLDEILALCSLISTILIGFASGPLIAQKMILTVGAMLQAGTPEGAANNAVISSIMMPDLLERIKKI